ncbi:hypothetical protein EJ04DRAFT_501705 [Polyplosphaeria fusca]|uniref:PAC domain-containing protein n=1 Tax=Polyplosphaeria fusca TaxID=682080 RepID=A0A9P4QQV0_9PLEO|nr:hypothetical protein EJ04DRAFT_501705 [Polyplosphaeria fusca]
MDGHRKRLSALSSYDLAPPPPTMSPTNAEYMSDRLFSAEHLKRILGEPALAQRFTAFLNRYRPHSAPTLVRHIESQKALTAVRYANLLADQMSPLSRRSSTSSSAAILDSKFENYSKRSIEDLVSDALPAYIAYRMVSLVTECLVKEITGNNTPLMQDLVQGLAEVYCMTDPSLPDNPIIFASEEFYNTTQYGRDYVIGKNCRFLQGPKTSASTVNRISNALRNGQDVSEIILNYKRDGTPFFNLVMMAPLMDHHGNVRYFIGCQIDISHLLEGGRGLESFKKMLDDENEKALPDPLESRPSLRALRDFGVLLNDEEIDIVKERGDRRNSIDSGRSTPTRNTPQAPSRRFVGMEEPAEPGLWPPSQFGSSGRLPGVYQNYILVRPYPSLRIIFTSAALRIPGLSQSRLMDRIGGPQHVRDGLLDALSQGIGVTAKVSWLAQSTKSHRSHTSQSNPENRNGDHVDMLEGKPRWIHCTPLLGSDNKPGVIMIVMVDREEITGSLNPSRMPNSPRTLSIRSHESSWPIRNPGAASSRFTSGKLYAEYMRREGREARSESVRPADDGVVGGRRERREVSVDALGRRGVLEGDVVGKRSMASEQGVENGVPDMREGAVRGASFRQTGRNGRPVEVWA